MIEKVDVLRAARLGGTAALAVSLLLVCPAQAGDYYSPIPYSPILIGPDSEGATPVERVPGKEYSHTNWFEVLLGGFDPNLVNIDDHDAFAVGDPLQVVSWDGKPGPIGGNSGSVDGFDFGVPGFNFPNGQVDALANRGDYLFKQVLRNEAALLFSVTADIGAGAVLPPAPAPIIPVGNHVHYEDPAGGGGVWATIEAPPAGPGPGPGVNHHVVEDLDALEVWGPEPPPHVDRMTEVEEGYLPSGSNTADADRFSLDGDFMSGVSVWQYSIPTMTVDPWVPHSLIVDAVEKLFLEPEFGPEARFEDRDAVDVDGTMARDLGDLPPPPGTVPPLMEPGDELLFTIDPIPAGSTVIDDAGAILGASPLIDGGEIMHLVKTGPGPGAFAIKFLTHGGHTWDTAFPVAATFGFHYEDVDALEAVGTLTGDEEVPEPGTLVLCGLAAVMMGVRFRRCVR